MGRGKDDPHLRSDLREKGEQLPVIAFDFAFVMTTSASGETEQKYSTTLLSVDADLFFVKVILGRFVQMRCGSSESFGADKPIWAWLSRHASWSARRKTLAQGRRGVHQGCLGR